MKKQEKIIFAVSLLAWGMAISPVLAMSQQVSSTEYETTVTEKVGQKNQQRQEKIEEKKATIAEKKEQMKNRICERVKARIRLRINRYENNQAKDKKIFSGLTERLDKNIKVFKEKGLDVSMLESDAKILKEKIEKLYATHQEFIDQLEVSEQYACDESSDKFKEELEKSRKVLPEVKTSIKEIRTYYKDVIRQDLIELRELYAEMLATKNQEEEEDVTESENQD